MFFNLKIEHIPLFVVSVTRLNIVGGGLQIRWNSRLNSPVRTKLATWVAAIGEWTSRSKCGSLSGSPPTDAKRADGGSNWLNWTWHLKWSGKLTEIIQRKGIKLRGNSREKGQHLGVTLKCGMNVENDRNYSDRASLNLVKWLKNEWGLTLWRKMKSSNYAYIICRWKVVTINRCWNPRPPSLLWDPRVRW